MHWRTTWRYKPTLSKIKTTSVEHSMLLSFILRTTPHARNHVTECKSTLTRWIKVRMRWSGDLAPTWVDVDLAANRELENCVYITSKTAGIVFLACELTKTARPVSHRRRASFGPCMEGSRPRRVDGSQNHSIPCSCNSLWS